MTLPREIRPGQRRQSYRILASGPEVAPTTTMSDFVKHVQAHHFACCQEILKRVLDE